ncbi:hypothetical protein [Helicobacter suis]|uniref:hypothetical protein n=1 Tax=Helicobacter suis TaxID=104628 RepID=UPI0013D52DA6|nr:hypothetical protein [Helicobacter suis]
MAGRIILTDGMGNNKVYEAGFSWTMLFFCPFVPLFRKDWKWACISWGCVALILVLVVQSSLLFRLLPSPALFIIRELSGFLYWMFAIIMALLYNKIYINGLLNKGYTPLEEIDKQILRRHGFKL